jgi:hypothetical protein
MGGHMECQVSASRGLRCTQGGKLAEAGRLGSGSVLTRGDGSRRVRWPIDGRKASAFASALLIRGRPHQPEVNQLVGEIMVSRVVEALLAGVVEKVRRARVVGQGLPQGGWPVARGGDRRLCFRFVGPQMGLCTLSCAARRGAVHGGDA